MNGADLVILGVLLGVALFGYLRAARMVRERWPVRGWAMVGIASVLSVLVFVALAAGRYVGALVLAAVILAWLLLRSRLRSGSPPS
ncbi:MAG TPA: hypothetical protein VF984_10795 [Actinomycetota bacterium]